MQVNERMDKRVTQYSNLYSWLFWPTVHYTVFFGYPGPRRRSRRRYHHHHPLPIHLPVVVFAPLLHHRLLIHRFYFPPGLSSVSRRHPLITVRHSLSATRYSIFFLSTTLLYCSSTEPTIPDFLMYITSVYYLSSLTM